MGDRLKRARRGVPGLRICLAKAAAEIVELFEIVEFQPNLAAFAAMADGDNRPERDAQTVLERARVGVERGGLPRRGTGSRGLGRLLAKPLDVADGQALRR